ncbi:MAG: hypothetical protein LAP40_14485 [Acidobacteriia bacterium]|nr:hypothetical protein [Terriglobia bacterium]
MSRPPRTDLKALFPIGLSVRYEAESPDCAGQGKTVAIGSELVRFLSDRDLDVGQKIRLELAWPAPLPDGTGLNLWMFGKVAKASFLEVEVRVSNYEFRTRRKARPAPAVPATHSVAGLARVARTGT